MGDGERHRDPARHRPRGGQQELSVDGRIEGNGAAEQHRDLDLGRSWLAPGHPEPSDLPSQTIGESQHLPALQRLQPALQGSDITAKVSHLTT